MSYTIQHDYADGAMVSEHRTLKEGLAEIGRQYRGFRSRLEYQGSIFPLSLRDEDGHKVDWEMEDGCVTAWEMGPRGPEPVMEVRLEAEEEAETSAGGRFLAADAEE